MGFRKTASVTSLGSFTVDTDGAVHKTAASLNPEAEQARRSYYVDGASKLNVRGILSKVADKYAISDDPADFIYEAIRANTVNIPNDNHDGFHRNELLRYDTALRTAVYLSYREKPHHVNHRTENSKTARGVILDVHYNDDAPALEQCPTHNCNTRTAERNNRDASGIHCIKCGATVKDEFVEALVAIDTKKDPVFAEGVRTGELKASSMGCNCTSTTCNVCGHVARSRAEFCDHIRGGNKGSYWTRTAENKWQRINASKADEELTKRGSALNAADFVSQSADGFELRKAFEYCLGVEFDELSRVDEPADQKALQREVLSKAANHAPTPAELTMESEQMIARARRRNRKTAMKFVVVRVEGDPMDTYAAETMDQAMALAAPEAGVQVEYAEIDADNAGNARDMANESGMWQPAPGAGMDQDAGDVTINVDTEGPLGPEVETLEEPGLEGPEQTMEDFTEDQLEPIDEPMGPAEEMSPEELGVIPPGASAPADDATRSASMSTFADAYRDPWKVQVTPKGNAQLVSPHGPVMLFKAAAEPKSDEDRRAFGREIITHLQQHGLFKTAERYDALYHAKFASVVDHAMDDMQDFADKYTKQDVAGGGDNDMAAVDGGSGAPADVRDSNDDDMADSKAVSVQDSQQDRSTDMDGEGDNAPDSSLTDRGSDMRDDPRSDINVGSDSALDDETHDHTERLAALVGTKVVEREGDQGIWNVSAFDKTAQSFVLTNRDLETRNVGGEDITNLWLQLDQAPATADDASIKTAERLKKLYAAKLDEAKRAHAEALTEARKAAVADYQRAVRIVAKRHALNLELSPLKEALGVVLCSDRVAGYDAVTQQPLEYVPIPSELAVHLVEAAWKEGADSEIGTLLDRAAELMNSDTEYLKSAETDIAKMAHKVPPVTAASMIDNVDREAAQTREAVLGGNMELTSGDTVTDGQGRRSSIQAALRGETKVNSLTSQYRR